MMGAAAAQEDAASELGKAGAKSQEWKSYSFKIASKTEGMPQRGGGQNPGERTTEGEYVAEKGLHGKAGESEVYKKGSKTAVKGRDGKWAAPEGGGRRGGRGLSGLTAPHETFKEIEKHFKKVEKTADGDAAVYSGELTADGIAKLGGGMGRMREGGESSGTAKVYVDASGEITKLEVNTKIKAKFQEREVEITTARTIEVSNLGKADFEIPEEVKKLLE